MLGVLINKITHPSPFFLSLPFPSLPRIPPSSPLSSPPSLLSLSFPSLPLPPFLNSGTYDVFDNRLVFDFGGDVKCSCHIRLVVVSDILQLIAPNGKFEPKKRKFDYLSRQSNTVEGEKPPS